MRKRIQGISDPAVTARPAAGRRMPLLMRGFTLLEVLIAMAIISGVLITVIYTTNYYLSLIARHEAVTVATLLGREKIRDVTDQVRDKSGRFPDPHEAVSFEVEIADTPYEGIRLVKMTVLHEGERVQLNRFVEKTR